MGRSQSRGKASLNCTLAQEIRHTTASSWVLCGPHKYAVHFRGRSADLIAQENNKGSMYVQGFDRHGSPIVYLKLHLPETGNRQGFLLHLIYCVERATACLDQREAELRARASNGEDMSNSLFGLPLWQTTSEDDAKVEPDGAKITVIVDFTGYRTRNRPRLATLYEAFCILRDHYPERLGVAYLLNVPRRISTLWPVACRWLRYDAHKVVIVKHGMKLPEIFDADFDRNILESCAGGDNRSAFVSNLFLSTQVDGCVFGTEFEAQRSAASMQTASSRAPASHTEKG